MTDQEMHDLKKVLEFVGAVSETLRAKIPLDDADVRGMQWMLTDATERLTRTLRDTSLPRDCPITPPTKP